MDGWLFLSLVRTFCFFLAGWLGCEVFSGCVAWMVFSDFGLDTGFWCCGLDDVFLAVWFGYVVFVWRGLGCFLVLWFRFVVFFWSCGLDGIPYWRGLDDDFWRWLG